MLLTLKPRAPLEAPLSAFWCALMKLAPLAQQREILHPVSGERIPSSLRAASLLWGQQKVTPKLLQDVI